MFRITVAATTGIILALAIGSRSVAQDIATGLLAHWKLDEDIGATTAVDSVGGFDGTIEGTVTTGLSARVDNGYLFAGEPGNKVVTTADLDLFGFNAPNQPFSLWGFVKMPEVVGGGNSDQQHIIAANIGGTDGRWNLYADGSTGNLRWFQRPGISANSSLNIDDDVWHLVGVSRDETNAYTLYLDDQSEAIGISADPFATNKLTLGGRPEASNFQYRGFLDDVRVYDRVLTADDINALLAQPFPPPGPTQWLSSSSTSWFSEGSWLGSVPNSNADPARFGQIPTTPNVTVIVDSPVTVKAVAFDNGVTSYIVAGTQTVTLDSDTDTVDITVEQAGAHEFQAAVDLVDNATADIVAGGRLDFNNALNLNGNTLTKSGDGILNINNQLNSGSGTVNVTAGVLGGSGEVGGDLNNQSDGTVAPGRSAGTLGVAGSYSQAAGATLAIEIGGTGDELFDHLEVTGMADLMGTIDISLIDGFTPADGNSFEIVKSSNLVTSGLALAGQSAGFSVSTADNSLFLDFAGPGGVVGDFNGDGAVNAADYTIWRDNLGSNTPLMNDDGLSVPVGAEHYALWKSNFGTTSSASQSGVTAVPEPSTGVLLIAMVAGVTLLTQRR